MTMFKHVGIRPTGELIDSTRYEDEIPPGLWGNFSKKFKKRMEYEPSTGKWWNQKELQSGCDCILKDPKSWVRDGTTLLYCKHCDEWFNIKQFEKLED